MAFDPSYSDPYLGKSYDPLYNLYKEYFPGGLSNDQLQQVWSTLQSAAPQQQKTGYGQSQWSPDNQAAINQLNNYARQFSAPAPATSAAGEAQKSASTSGSTS